MAVGRPVKGLGRSFFTNLDTAACIARCDAEVTCEQAVSDAQLCWLGIHTMSKPPHRRTPGAETRVCYSKRGWDGEAVAARLPAPNTVERNVPGVRGYGGTCTCPSGHAYQVGETGGCFMDSCANGECLACVGGVPGKCSSHNPGGAGVKVTCGGAPFPSPPPPPPSPPPEGTHTPPWTNYMEMLQDDVQGKKSGFLAGNHVYYMGGVFLVQEKNEDETIGLTHPFFNDLRSRGTGEAFDPKTGLGNDFRGWEFYRSTRIASGTVVLGDIRWETPAPTRLYWRPDKLIIEYNLTSPCKHGRRV